MLIKRALIVFFSLLLFCSCGKVERPIQINEIRVALHGMQEKNEKIDIMADPVTVYSIEVTDGMIMKFSDDIWKETTAEYAGDNITGMLYCDFPHETEEDVFSRVAFLSNGCLLVQICTAEGFGSAEWYLCTEETRNVYNELLALL